MKLPRSLLSFPARHKSRQRCNAEGVGERLIGVRLTDDPTQPCFDGGGVLVEVGAVQTHPGLEP
jgi:hypothetical protein